ncbi:hypothetical protein T458_08665 [Brevibacillus panacihumi W25]|uniref:Uncharacterized protein n=1 Tax=Brevibacillus panacihumi W25 TaxID=1408254 RepID=V6M9B1_9BACL|nr:hypothetical protein T458_08665 [Brevibacillus panacihumi W25]
MAEILLLVSSGTLLIIFGSQQMITNYLIRLKNNLVDK